MTENQKVLREFINELSKNLIMKDLQHRYLKMDLHALSKSVNWTDQDVKIAKLIQSQNFVKVDEKFQIAANELEDLNTKINTIQLSTYRGLTPKIIEKYYPVSKIPIFD